MSEPIISSKDQPLFDKYPDLHGESPEVLNKVRGLELTGRAKEIMLAGSFDPPELTEGSLSSFLDQPLPNIEFLIHGLAVVGHSVTITAKYKTGKTTLLINLIKSLLDNEPFLGRFEVKPLDGRIAFLNFEMDETDLQRELLKSKIANPQNMLAPVNLRGAKFSLLNEQAQEWLIDYLKRNETEVAVLDTYTRAISQAGIDENDNFGTSKFTAALDYIKRESGTSNLFMTAHMGRAKQEEGEERTRGATSLNDWQDVGWTYTRKNGENAYLASQGRRGTNQDAFAVEFNHETLVLSATGRTRSETRVAEESKDIEEKIVAILKDRAEEEIIRKTRIYTLVDSRQENVRNALNRLIEAGTVIDDAKKGLLLPETPNHMKM